MKRKDIYDDFKFNKTSDLHGLYKNISACEGFKSLYAYLSNVLWYVLIVIFPLHCTIAQ